MGIQEIVGNELEQFFEQCLSEFLLLDIDALRIVKASSGALENLGYDYEQLCTKTLADLEYGADARSLRRRLAPLIEGEAQRLCVPSIFRRCDGSTYPIRLQIQRMTSGGRDVLFVNGEDVSADMATDALVSHASTLLETSPDPMAIFDHDGRILVANTKVCDLLGYAASELPGMAVEQLLPERYRVRHTEQRRQFSGRPGSREIGARLPLVALTKDERELPVEISLTPLPTRDNLLVSAAIRSVQEDADIRQALRINGMRFRELFESATDIIHVVDKDGAFLYVNPAWHRALGYDAQAIENKRIFDVVHPQERGQAREFFTRVLGGVSLKSVRRRLVTRDGRVRVFEGGATCQRHEGKTMSVCAILHDVTEREEVERELQRARDIAENAAATKSRFLAAASHDLRQPLQALGLYLSILRRRQGDEIVAELGQKMETSIDVMASLLDALLDISRFEAGSIQPKPESFDLQPLLDRLVSSNREMAEHKGLTLVCERASCVVRTDRDLLERILGNLLGNAVRYTEHGGVTVRCRASDGTVVVEIKDTGIGIAQTDIDKIFDEFYQAENSTRDRKKGLGLGLSIVRYIARLLELPLNVQSAPGEGSVFSVSVPLGEDGQQRAVGTSDSPQAFSQTLRVLLVEDDPDIRAATRELLVSLGCDVVVADSAESALETLDVGEAPDVVVTDYRLPGKTGRALIGDLRSRCGDGLACVIVTGDTASPDLSEAPPARCTVLHKPVKAQRLIEAINRLTAAP